MRSEEAKTRSGTPTTSERPDIPSPPKDTALTRRTALKMMSATAMLTAAGCTRKPLRHIVSVSDRPEYRRPGIPLYYRSTFTDGDWPYGILVKTLDGRPIKIEGLPEHPLNQGTSTAQMQSSLLSLYDPERLKAPKRGGETITWEDVDKQVIEALSKSKSSVILTRAALGIAERRIVKRLVSAVPGAQHFVYAPNDDRARRETWQAVYGADGVMMPKLSGARIILSLDSDFLGTDGEVLGATRDFAASRKIDPATGTKSLSRLYVAESAMTVTGTAADHRIPLRPVAVFSLVEALRKAVDGHGAELQGLVQKSGLDAEVLAALAKDLGQNKNAAVVLAGPHLPPDVHASVALLNESLGALGHTLTWNPTPPTLPVSDPAAIKAAFEAGPDVALFVGVNPVHDWPGGGFEALLAKAKLSVGHGLTENETLAACKLALPSTHNMESWNDATPLPGVKSLCQPMIAPLFGGRQDAESLFFWAKPLAKDDPILPRITDWHDYVRFFTQGKGTWTEQLRAGVVLSEVASKSPSLDRAKANALVDDGGHAGSVGGMDVVILPDGSVGDGRFAGNAWLLELADPVSKLVWDNAAALSPASAKRLGVCEGDWLTIKAGKRSLKLPALIQPGVAGDAVVLTLGLGRTAGAGIGDGVGFNVAALLGVGITSRLIFGAAVEKAGGEAHELVRTQGSFDQHDRPLALSGTRADYDADPTFAKHVNHVPALVQIDEEWDYSKGHKWGMGIDLSACTGCGACTVACQAENNIPVVGKEECANDRDMPWIRLDRYESGDEANPTVDQQPMLCQHCDNAPCENVCPVNATAHSPEGLNEQVYNRCVGTRYCLNNCPYKVRKFNYFNYTRRNITSPEEELLQNPHVTVRMRGVMEKCSFCIQRINDVKFKASNEGAALEDGAIQVACQQACPARAIVFGDVNDAASKIAAARKSPLAYHVLEEINVRPNVTYLAKVRNPSVMKKDAAGGDAHGGKGGH